MTVGYAPLPPTSVTWLCQVALDHLDGVDGWCRICRVPLCRTCRDALGQLAIARVIKWDPLEDGRRPPQVWLQLKAVGLSAQGPALDADGRAWWLRTRASKPLTRTKQALGRVRCWTVAHTRPFSAALEAARCGAAAAVHVIGGHRP